MMNVSNVIVVVVGRNYTSRLGMIRAVGMAGYKVSVIKTNGMPEKKDIDAYSKYVKDYLYAREPNRKELIRILISLKSNNCKTIIIPVDDYAASTIDENIELLKNDFLFPHINMEQGAINRLMDKNYQKQLARQAGLNVAKGWVVNVDCGNFIIPRDVAYPVFPKPQVSFKGSKSCMQRCDNQYQLGMALKSVVGQKKDCPILLEEYCEITNEYALLGMSDGKDVFFPAVIQMLESGKGPHHGVTLLGKVLLPEKFAYFLNQLKDFVRELHFEGLFDIDFYESNGVLYFNEMNLRFGASGYAITHSGINLPYLLINHLLGKPNNFDKNIVEESIFVNEKVAYDDYFNGYISKSDYNDYMKRADFGFIQSTNDEMPYKAFLSEKFSYKKLYEKYVRSLKKALIKITKN